jgi:hypothetical protein
MMVLTLDNLAHRYNVLPSEALERATTFDLYVLDVSAKWSKYQSDLADGKATKPTQQLSQEQMMEMIKRVKERKQGD